MTVKTSSQIQIMQEGGEKLARIRDELLQLIVPGAIPLEIDNIAKDLIKKTGGTPSFMTVNDYAWATCISVNDGVVHGVPDRQPFKEGDVVGLDVGLLYKGFHTDTSWSKIVGWPQYKADNEVNKFLEIGEKTLKKAIAEAKPGNHIGHISKVIQENIEGFGYSVVKSLVGHGVGHKLHEAPQIPGYLKGDIKNSPEIFTGMTLAIEVIYAQGNPQIGYKNEDGWSLVTVDGSIAGLFEQTIAVTQNKPIVLTESKK